MKLFKLKKRDHGANITFTAILHEKTCITYLGKEWMFSLYIARIISVSNFLKKNSTLRETSKQTLQ